MKKCLPLGTSVLALILECLPFGVVLYFMNPYGAPWVSSYSYFSLTPFGYANFGPLLTGVFTCVILLLCLLYLLWPKKGLSTAIVAISGTATATSLMPLMFGLRSFTWVNALVSLLLLLTLGSACYLRIKK